MTGAELMDAIAEAARLQGWLVAHWRPARTAQGWRTACQYDAKGFPDLILARDRVIYAEVKGDGDRLRPEQRAWLELLELAGAEVYTWRPADWLSGAVEAVLRKGAAGAAS